MAIQFGNLHISTRSNVKILPKDKCREFLLNAYVLHNIRKLLLSNLNPELQPPYHKNRKLVGIAKIISTGRQPDHKFYSDTKDRALLKHLKKITYVNYAIEIKFKMHRSYF